MLIKASDFRVAKRSDVVSNAPLAAAAAAAAAPEGVRCSLSPSLPRPKLDLVDGLREMALGEEGAEGILVFTAGREAEWGKRPGDGFCRLVLAAVSAASARGRRWPLGSGVFSS